MVLLISNITCLSNFSLLSPSLPQHPLLMSLMLLLKHLLLRYDLLVNLYSFLIVGSIDSFPVLAHTLIQ